MQTQTLYALLYTACSKMATKLEKKIITILGITITIFLLSTLFIFQHVSSVEFINNHPQLRNSIDLITDSSSRVRGTNDVVSIVDQISFLSQDDISKAMTKIPFPQSIQNEEMEPIVHPAVQMMNFIKELKKESDMKDQEAAASNEEEGGGGGDDATKSLSNNQQVLMVPKFWNPSFIRNEIKNNKTLEIRSFLGNYGEKLITPSQAKRIGSYTRPTNGDDDDIILETIFVSIASYRDYRCPHTLRQLFAHATYPERIRVAIVDQLKPETDVNCAKSTICDHQTNEDGRHKEGEEDSEEDGEEDLLCKYSHLIDVYEMDATLAVGPVLARHIGNRMYRGEYFAMQSDAHMEFIKGWDVDIIQQWKSAKNEMAVLTTYVSDVDGHYNHTTGMSIATSRPKMCNTDFDTDYYDNRLSNLMHGQQPEGEPDIFGEPTLHPFWAAGFSFARGHFLVQVPYDQYLPMIFQGEEINIGLRGFTYGYDFYAPERSVIYHYYSNGGKDTKVKSFYENSGAFRGLEEASMARLLAITQLIPGIANEVEAGGEKDGSNAVNDNEITKQIEDSKKELNGIEYETILWNAVEEKMYGIGKVRTVKKFLRTFGIDIETKKVQHHLCRFVGRPMNKMFLPNIRIDSMGIDYDQITYEFKDPKIHGLTWEGENGDDQGAGDEGQEEKAEE